MAQPLNYRGPIPGGSGRIADALRRREWSAIAIAWVQGICGLATLWLGPAFLAMCYFTCANLFWGPISWQRVFWVFMIVITPLLFWTEWRMGPSYGLDEITTSVRADGRNAFQMMALGQWGMLAAYGTSPREMAAIYQEIFLWGPRQIMEAVSKLRRIRTVHSLDYDRADRVIETLRSQEHAVVIDQMLDPGEKPEHLAKALAYLMVYDWIDMSKDAQRVWLLSESRAILAKC